MAENKEKSKLPTLRLVDNCNPTLRLVREVQTIATKNGDANVCTVEVLNLGGAEVDDEHACGDNPPNVYTVWPTDKLADLLTEVDEATEGGWISVRRRGTGRTTRWFVKAATYQPPVKPDESDSAGPPEGGISEEDLPF